MAVLTQQQRNTLESAVKQARRVSEAGARNALRAFAVDNPEPFPHMNPEQRGLRNRLRSKARLLGDELPSSGHQHIDQLTYELAYEYWHKMLFAKFLEANGLLMHPDGVSVTMEECEELAKEEGYSDKWDIAASFASKMLPAIFRPEDPLMQITFAPDDRIKLEEILEGLDNYIFTGDDALGWVYQFWQSEAKDAINKSGDKIDGKKLPAVTQLFTEPYMVHFLIDNTIGAWWVSRNPGVKPPVKFEYLRMHKPDTKPVEVPAAGKFEGWPDTTAEITAMDPCMGSGHFVVSLFIVLVNLRMYEEGLTKEEATDRVIAENLHGLEIDPRCTQIAAFNLALTSWKFCGRYKELPEMNLACSGLAPKGRKDDWIKLVGKINREDDKVRMENGMAMLYDHFQLAPELGSLLDPTTIKADLHTASFNQLFPVLNKALQNETDNDFLERGVMAAGISKAGDLLSKKYSFVITNVPYLGKGKMDTILSKYVEREYKSSKSDLATVFLERYFKSLIKSGIICIVIPQNWLFLKSYKSLRENLLRNTKWNFLTILGPGAFSQISGEVVKVLLFSLSNQKIPNNSFFGIDVTDSRTSSIKDEDLKQKEIIKSLQSDQNKNPDSRISLEPLSEEPLLSVYAYSYHGLTTGDKPRMTLCLWELSQIKTDIWIYYQGTVQENIIFGGANSLLRWENGQGCINELIGARKDGTEAWGHKGISISQMGSLNSTIYLGSAFDNTTAAIVPYKEEDLASIWAFCSSENYIREIRRIDKSLYVTCATLVKVPFDKKFWNNAANEKYPNELPKPYSDDPTQWLFHGNPIKSDQPLHVALSRFLGYRWPAESDNEMELSDEARKLILETKKIDRLSDNDGIICIPSVNKEETAANRLRDYLKEVFGEDYADVFFDRTKEKITLPVLQLNSLLPPKLKFKAQQFSSASLFM
ncbi:MAG: N-6 DNA methylase, partial [Bacteroidales bacterium]|nr:N-6 DNA methylase [Bacteroidales bacterium]